MRHSNHRAFQSALSGWAIARSIKHLDRLADELDVPVRCVTRWLRKGVMPTKANLAHIAEVTGDNTFLGLRGRQ